MRLPRALVRTCLTLGLAGTATAVIACVTKSEAKAPATAVPPLEPQAPTPAVAPAVAIDPAKSGAAAEDTAAPGVDKLPGIDVSAIDEGQRRWLRELMEKYPSPCGKSHSLLTSLRSDPRCKRSVFAGRYLVTLLKAGLMKSECEEQYERRFVSPEMGACEIAQTPLRGNPSAPVTICEFSDFQCPHCKGVEPMLSRILDEYREQVKLYYKNYPISKLHPEAREAAAAAVAAGMQNKFWPMHDKLFANQDHLSAADLEHYAAELKLDVKKWKADIAPAKERVDKDHTEGEKLDLTGTPTFFINGRKYAGPLRYEEIKDWVEEELNK